MGVTGETIENNGRKAVDQLDQPDQPLGNIEWLSRGTQTSILVPDPGIPAEAPSAPPPPEPEDLRISKEIKRDVIHNCRRRRGGALEGAFRAERGGEVWRGGWGSRRVAEEGKKKKKTSLYSSLHLLYTTLICYTGAYYRRGG
jgi:hypothetical protein